MGFCFVCHCSNAIGMIFSFAVSKIKPIKYCPVRWFMIR